MYRIKNKEYVSGIHIFAERKSILYNFHMMTDNLPSLHVAAKC